MYWVRGAFLVPPQRTTVEAPRWKMADHELLDPESTQLLLIGSGQAPCASGAPLVAASRGELDRENRSSPSPPATLPSPGRCERSLGVLRNDTESGSHLAPYAERNVQESNLPLLSEFTA